MQCVILCGGFATRLRPLTLDRPKHLLPIAGRPMLDYLLDRLAEAGMRHGIVVTNHRFISQFTSWESSGSHALPLTILDDGTETNETRLGSIGDLRFALDASDVRDDFLVINGDNLFTFSLQLILSTFRQRGNTIALYDVGSIEVARLMGHATCDATGRVTDFVEKPQQPASTLSSVGIYFFQAAVRHLVTEYIREGNSPDRTGDFIKWLPKKAPVFAHPIPAEAGVWFDIGSFEQYQEANRAFGGEPIDAEKLNA